MHGCIYSQITTPYPLSVCRLTACIFQFMNFLERLARALNMDEISHDIGVDLHTESLLVRAEQLARLESDKLVDKVSKDECFFIDDD